MLAAIPLVDAALLFAKGTGGAQAMALICLLLWPLCRLLQQKYAAT
jgi:hypothetical protein